MPNQTQAKITLEDESVLNLKDILESTGHILAVSGKQNSVHHVVCISTLVKSYEQDCKLTKKLWPLCASIHKDSKVHGQVWQGLFYLERHLSSQNQSLYDEPNETRLIRAGRQRILEEINKVRLIKGNKASAVYYAQGLVNICNEKRPMKSRIFIPFFG